MPCIDICVSRFVRVSNPSDCVLGGSTVFIYMPINNHSYCCCYSTYLTSGLDPKDVYRYVIVRKPLINNIKFMALHYGPTCHVSLIRRPSSFFHASAIKRRLPLQATNGLSVLVPDRTSKPGNSNGMNER